MNEGFIVMGDANEGYYTAPFRTVSNVPTTFRVAEYPDGARSIQGGYPFTEGWVSGIEWRDLPMVKVGEDGQEIA